MALTVSLIAAVKEDAHEQEPPPWEAAAWPRRPVIAGQQTAEGSAGYELLRRLIGGSSDNPGSSATVAQLTAAMDGLAPAADRWRADPVSLIPDRDQLVVFPGKMANLLMAEAEALVQVINDQFRQEFQLEIGVPHRWYLTLVKPLEFTARPLDAVSGASAARYQAGGPDAMRLRQWLTEIEMLLHDVPVNQAREQQDQFQINSVWVWGAEPADLHNPTDNPLADGVESSLPVADLVIADPGWAAALAEACDTPVTALPPPHALAEQLPADGEVIIDLARVDGDRLADYDYVKACCEALRSSLGRQVSRIDIYSIARQGWTRQQWRPLDFSLLGRFRAKIAQAVAGGRG
ncbi:MAG: hypothetical protein VW985_09620 [Gammaproteobacteria bacterium]